MDHRAIKEKLLLYPDRALSESELSELEKHLGGCEECRQQLGRLQGLSRMLGGSAAVAPSETFTSKVMERIRSLEETPRAGWIPVLWPRWVMPALGYAFAVALMTVAIAHRVPFETGDPLSLAGVAPAEAWVLSGQAPDMQTLVGITMEES
ncbi:MAG: zf-HC2 domain-containing protein [Candidatus Omnitrophota bacterium]|jgi:predicted anti-sigma-YlaC factor YlaD